MPQSARRVEVEGGAREALCALGVCVVRVRLGVRLSFVCVNLDARRK